MPLSRRVNPDLPMKPNERLIERAMVNLPMGTLERLKEKARQEGTLQSRIMRDGILMALEAKVD